MSVHDEVNLEGKPEKKSPEDSSSGNGEHALDFIRAGDQPTDQEESHKV